MRAIVGTQISAPVVRLCIASSSMIDLTTDAEAWVSTRITDGKQLRLVASDEFTKDGRSFDGKSDKMFEALMKPDYTNEAIQFCKALGCKDEVLAVIIIPVLRVLCCTDNSSREYVTTKDGNLIIATKAVKTYYKERRGADGCIEERVKNYTSGMVQTWNKFCFTGGVLEMSIELPGEANSGGYFSTFKPVPVHTNI